MRPRSRAPRETLDPNDFTVTVNGNEVGVVVGTPTLANAWQIELTIDDELETDDNVTAVCEDSSREKVTTAEPGRDGIGDGDLLRSWDTRSFEGGDPGPTFP